MARSMASVLLLLAMALAMLLGSADAQVRASPGRRVGWARLERRRAALALVKQRGDRAPAVRKNASPIPRLGQPSV